MKELKDILLTFQLAGVAIYGKRSVNCKESITRKISLWKENIYHGF